MSKKEGWRKKGSEFNNKPSGTKGDRMELVCGQTIPDEQLAVLRRTHEVVRVRSPLHRIDLRQVTLQRATDLQLIVLGDRRDVVRILLHCGFHSHKKQHDISPWMSKKEMMKVNEQNNKRVVSFMASLLARISSFSFSTARRAFCTLSLASLVVFFLSSFGMAHNQKKENPTLFSANETQHPDCQWNKKSTRGDWPQAEREKRSEKTQTESVTPTKPRKKGKNERWKNEYKDNNKNCTTHNLLVLRKHSK